MADENTQERTAEEWTEFLRKRLQRLDGNMDFIRPEEAHTDLRATKKILDKLGVSFETLLDMALTGGNPDIEAQLTEALEANALLKASEQFLLQQYEAEHRRRIYVETHPESAKKLDLEQFKTVLEKAQKTLGPLLENLAQMQGETDVDWLSYFQRQVALTHQNLQGFDGKGGRWVQFLVSSLKRNGIDISFDAIHRLKNLTTALTRTVEDQSAIHVMAHELTAQIESIVNAQGTQTDYDAVMANNLAQQAMIDALNLKLQTAENKKRNDIGLRQENNTLKKELERLRNDKESFAMRVLIAQRKRDSSGFSGAHNSIFPAGLLDTREIRPVEHEITKLKQKFQTLAERAKSFETSLQGAIEEKNQALQQGAVIQAVLDTPQALQALAIKIEALSEIIQTEDKKKKKSLKERLLGGGVSGILESLGDHLKAVTALQEQFSTATNAAAQYTETQAQNAAALSAKKVEYLAQIGAENASALLEAEDRKRSINEELDKLERRAAQGILDYAASVKSGIKKNGHSVNHIRADYEELQRQLAAAREILTSMQPGV